MKPYDEAEAERCRQHGGMLATLDLSTDEGRCTLWTEDDEPCVWTEAEAEG